MAKNHSNCQGIITANPHHHKRVDLIVSQRRVRKALRYSIYAVITFLVLWSIQSTVIKDTEWERIGGLVSVTKAILRFLPPDFTITDQLVKPTIETFMIACLGTMIAVILAIPVAWFAASNITPFRPITYPIGRFIMILSRSVHEIVWGLLFVAAVGLGAFPGILAVGTRSIGFVSKLTAETIEDINPGPVEAIKSTGANGLQVALFGIIPQILPIFIGNAIFQWDINIRRATVMGLVGAGGLGLTFHRQLVMYNYGGVTMVIIAILFLIGIGEIVSYYTRKAII